MKHRFVGQTGLRVSPLGFGAFKIGRNQHIKYAEGYALPDERAVRLLLNGLLDDGICYIDTAPAYGISEERIGQTISHRRDEFVLSTKVGETFKDGQSAYDFSEDAIVRSVDRSLRRLKTDFLDLLFLHSDGNDLTILRETDAVESLLRLKESGKVRAIGLSGKTTAGAREALKWADALMVEYHCDDCSHAEVIDAAGAAGVGVIVKKGLAAGRLPASEAIPFVLQHPAVSSLVIGGLNGDHIRQNMAIAAGVECIFPASDDS